MITGSFASSAQVFLLFGAMAATYFIINFAIDCSARTIKTAY